MLMTNAGLQEQLKKYVKINLTNCYTFDLTINTLHSTFPQTPTKTDTKLHAF